MKIFCSHALWLNFMIFEISSVFLATSFRISSPSLLEKETSLGVTLWLFYQTKGNLHKMQTVERRFQNCWKKILTIFNEGAFPFFLFDNPTRNICFFLFINSFYKNQKSSPPSTLIGSMGEIHEGTKKIKLNDSSMLLQFPMQQPYNFN